MSALFSMWHTVHASKPVHMLSPLPRAPIPTFTHMYLPSQGSLALCPGVRYAITPYTPPSHHLWGRMATVKVGAAVFSSPIFLTCETCAYRGPLLLSVNKDLCCLQRRHTAAGICLKPGVSETSGALGTTRTLGTPTLPSVVTHARVLGPRQACTCSTGRRRCQKSASHDSGSTEDCKMKRGV